MLTHDFKPAFRKTISNLDSHSAGRYECSILMDDRSSVPEDLVLSRVLIKPCKRHPSKFDPLGQAHNFYIDAISSDKGILDRYPYFWIFENDAYYHGNVVEFMETHDRFDSDLLVPEYGLRDPNWCWISSAEGMTAEAKGVTAVAYRASSKFMRQLIESMESGISAHMEILLPSICKKFKMTLDQFIPDTVGICNTFGNPLMELLEEEIRNGSTRYAQKKLYHPVKS